MADPQYPKIVSKPTITRSQQGLLDTVSKEIEKHIGETATPMPEDISGVAALPEQFQQGLEAFNAARDLYAGDIGNAIKAQLNMSGVYKPDYERVQQEWRTNIADPLSNYYSSAITPGIQEEFAGNLYSTRAADVVARRKGEFMGAYATPELSRMMENERAFGFQSSEAALGRQLQAIPLGSALSMDEFNQYMNIGNVVQGQEQAQLQWLQNEFLRTTQEASPWYQMGQGYATQPTMENIVMYPQQEPIRMGSGRSSGFGSFLGGIGSVLGGLGTFGLGGGFGGIFG